MTNSISFILSFKAIYKLFVALSIALIFNGFLFADSEPEYIVKIEKTADGFPFRVFLQNHMNIDKSTPVYYLYELDGKDNKLEIEYLKLIKSKNFVLVIIENLKEFNGIGQLRQIYLDISKIVNANYSVHPERNYFTGNMDGALIAMAVAKWVDKDVKGILLFDGLHQPIQGHPLLKSPIYAFAKKDSKELRAFQNLKPKYEEFNKDFVIMEYDNPSGLPESKSISNAMDTFDDKWIRFYDDILPVNLLLREEMVNKNIKSIETLYNAKKFEETIEQVEIFINDFSNTTNKKILIELDKIQKLKNVIAKEVTVQALIEHRVVMTEYKEREKNYKNLLETIVKFNGIIEKYPNSKSAILSKDEISKIQEIIFLRKLNIENINSLVVVSEFLKFVETSDLGEESKVVIRREFKKAEEAKDYSDLIPNCLVLMNREYANGLTSFGREKMKMAEKYFDSIKPEGNPYLKAYQLYYLARVNIILDNYERAEEILNDFLKSNLNYSTHQVDGFFLLAVCYYNQFKRDKSRALLLEFEKRFPDAPERMLVGAYQLLNKIDYFEEGSVVDVEERMEYSRRKLKMEDIDKPAQDNQEKIVTLLDKLIKEAQQSEQNQRDKNKRKGKAGKGNPDRPAEESEAPEGESKIGNLKKINRGNKEDQWGKERDKEREKIMNDLKEKFPERYRELIEQYYKGLHKNDE
jgi:outer membrane protein assembly factor BamD (BamD/ComL family)